MIQNYQTKSVCVYDQGLFVELAVRLAKDFGQVYYFSPWESAFPKSNDILIGKGIPGIERVNNFFDIIDNVDLFVFPDIYSGSIQKYLVEKCGKRVWGSRYGDSLELYRKETKEYMKSIGIDIGPYEVIIGLNALREYLKEHEHQWVKISFTRGDMETFEAENYDTIEPKLDELEHNLGAKKEIMEFIVEDAIPADIEIGYDGYTIDGKFPSQGMWGLEIKDKGYIGVFSTYEDMPKQIWDINKKLEPALRNYQYRNFFSTEFRMGKDKIPYVIDLCCRAGSPPSELYQNMYMNLADILWFGAEGKVIDPIPAGKYGAEMLIHSAWADKNWQAVNFPEKIRDQVKFRNLTIINGKYYVVPQAIGLPEIAAVVAIGDSVEEVIKGVQELAKQVTGYYIDIFPDCLDTAQEEIDRLKKMGITLKPSVRKASDIKMSDILKRV